MIQKRVEFRNRRGETLHGFLRIPGDADDEKHYPGIVICHDFRSNKDSENIFEIWNNLSRSGFAVLRFDFAGHGDSEGEFSQFTITRHIEDLKAAIDFLMSQDKVLRNLIGVIGDSFGGMISVLCAADREYSTMIKSVVTLGAHSSVESFVNRHINKHQYKQILDKGYFQFHDFSEIKRDFIEDLVNHDMEEALKNINCPTLFIHGDSDEIVPLPHVKSLFIKAKDPKEIEIVEDGDHHFTTPEHRESMHDRVSAWFRRTLSTTS